MAEPKIDFDIVEAQTALRNIYGALKKHERFWTNWLGDRIGIMGDFFAGSEEELKAAQALGDALQELSRIGRILMLEEQ